MGTLDPWTPLCPRSSKEPPGQGDRGPQHARYFDHRGGGLKGPATLTPSLTVKPSPPALLSLLGHLRKRPVPPRNLGVAPTFVLHWVRENELPTQGCGGG